MRTSESLREAIDLATSGGYSMVRCPAHEDGEPSLRVGVGTTQPVVFHCHAGCEPDDILAAEGLTWADVSAELEPVTRVRRQDRWTPAGEYSHVYSYVSPSGVELFQVLRIPTAKGGKTFRQRHWNSTEDKWSWNLDGVERVLYRLPDVIDARDEGETIWVVEGEKDADTAVANGLHATTMPMGAGKWQQSYTEFLRGADVVIVADADATGRAHARDVRDYLLAADCTVRIVEAAAGCKDLTDHFEAGHGVDDFLETNPLEGPPAVTYGADLHDIMERQHDLASFVVPNVMARGERMLITGLEGRGKSLLIRQMAIQAASGIHWWTHADMPPRRVLLIDGENSPPQVQDSWRDLYGLVRRHGHDVERGSLTVLEEWDSEIDLLSTGGREWLLERVHGYRPDLIMLGPLYTLCGRDLKEDESVRRLKVVLNEARSLYKSGLVMEHHAPHKEPGARERAIRPYGSSTFLKWPDFGYGLRPLEVEGAFEFEKFRWPRVRSRIYPSHLRWGRHNTDEWPWEPDILDEFGNPAM